MYKLCTILNAKQAIIEESEYPIIAIGGGRLGGERIFSPQIFLRGFQKKDDKKLIGVLGGGGWH